MTDYWKRWPVPLTFANKDDTAQGLIVALGDLNAKCPELHIRGKDGFVRIVRVTHPRLHERLAELQPAEGDRIRITYTGELPFKGKQFTVELRRAGEAQQ